MNFDPEIFASQFVTFVIGMWIIYKVYLKPLAKHIDERRDGIQKDLHDADKARQQAEAFSEEVKAERAKLAAEGQAMIEKAKADAEALREKTLAQSRQEQEQLVEQARRQIEQDKQNALREIRAESAELIIAATEKLVAKNLDRKTQEKLVAGFIKEVSPK
jgi:F-type H+-transporting ATPase subunit b